MDQEKENVLSKIQQSLCNNSPGAAAKPAKSQLYSEAFTLQQADSHERPERIRPFS